MLAERASEEGEIGKLGRKMFIPVFLLYAMDAHLVLNDFLTRSCLCIAILEESIEAKSSRG